MTGKYRIVVRNNKVQFTLDIERNITIIQGDSASGKTTLIDLIDQYYRMGKSSGISLSCKVPVAVCKTAMWQIFIENIHNSIIFLDEDNDFVTSKEFAESVKKSDCYFVIITREDLHQLPYSVNSILKLQKTGSRSKVTYNRAYPVYDKVDTLYANEEREILTEDSGAGNEMFTHIAAIYGTKCASAGGKSNIKSYLISHKDTKLIITADGAAFGADMADVYKIVMESRNRFELYLPESFEWIILSSGIVHTAELDEILKAPWEYIKSEKYESWEQYFTHLLEEITKDTPLQYSKSRLAKAYMVPENVKKIVDVVIRTEEE